MHSLTPKQIVAKLDEHIIGQHDAKKAVAIALRNRFRRKQLPEDLQAEIMPKNIIMMGPTGVGKTEIARRLANLVEAPFIKVEATKFTEVGYVGRNAESMVRELLETAIRMEKVKRMAENEEKAQDLANKRILNLLINPKKEESNNPLGNIFGYGQRSQEKKVETEEQKAHKERLKERLDNGDLEKMIIEIEVEEKSSSMQFIGGAGDDLGINVGDLFGNILPSKKKRKRVPISQAREILAAEESENLLDMDDVINTAIERTEQSGIVFLDEIDKIAAKTMTGGPDVSREGVQRDILPIVEGTTVTTKYGPVRTDYILFIAAGAFHVASPSDLIPELQGRFPLRVELSSLSEGDLRRILVEPKHSLIKQYIALLSTEHVELNFTEDSISEIAKTAKEINDNSENIGARRLHTMLERILEDISYEASDIEEGSVYTIDKAYVQEKIDSVIKDEDLKRFII
jgi:ATP-dependent HslUV protease ATP-binding subunit HslU